MSLTWSVKRIDTFIAAMAPVRRGPGLPTFRFYSAHAAPPEIACDDPHAYVIDGAAFVICTEHLPDGDLVATNVFALEHGRWRLVHHQAGPAPITAEGKAERTVH